MTLFNVGDVVTVTNVFTVDGVPTDPTTITLTITDPSGATSSYTYAGGTVTRDLTGTYHVDISATSAGIWHGVWAGTGAAVDIAEISFTVYTAVDRTLYCSEEELKTYLGSPGAGTGYDTQFTMALQSACRSIDAYCNRMFWLTDLEPHTFIPAGYYELDLRDDIGSTDGMIVATDNDGDGVYETVWADADWQLFPFNAPYASPEAEPWTKLRAVRTRTFPRTAYNLVSRLNRIQVTARWGWPAIPANVRQASLIKAARIFHRKNTPAGIATFDEFGPVRINRQEDGDVMLLLGNYVRSDSVMIA